MEQKEIAKAIKDYVDKNYKNNVTLSMISEELFVSNSTVCHYFKQEYGVTIKQYINSKRAMEAKQLIKSGASPTLVCEKLGFYNYTTFFRVYKKKFGVSPKKRNSQD